ncbi:hypothetical protein [Bosea vaviloviae]|nr:hypothetical protein [Bosea vaviloviae]
MQREVTAFEWKVGTWAAEVPIGGAVYIGLDPLNHSLQLMTRILNGEKDGQGFERRSLVDCLRASHRNCGDGYWLIDDIGQEGGRGARQLLWS